MVEAFFGIGKVITSPSINSVSRVIEENDYIAMDGDDILVAGKTLQDTAWEVIDKTMAENERSIINLFYGLNVLEAQLEYIEEEIREKYMYCEICRIPTEERIYDLSVSFE